MNLNSMVLTSACLFMAPMASCADEPDAGDVNEYPLLVPADSSFYKENPLWLRHKDASLKILAIGNSYTNNATDYLPWLTARLNADSVCMAKLTQSGCSLKMHWENHTGNAPDYSFHYADQGKWKVADIKTIDEALALLDWDIITLQQYSGWSGLYYTYQPYLDNLVSLFRQADPDASLAWHYTWPYTRASRSSDFKNYGNNPEKMYEAIMAAGSQASAAFDLRLPSATLIKRLREEFPEVDNGFSSDASHIDDWFARYALASLWYDVLVGPFCGTSRVKSTVPPDVNDIGAERMEEIIAGILCSFSPD